MVPSERSCHKVHTCPNMKALSLTIKMLWQMLNFFKSRSKVTVKVTSSTFMVLLERSCHTVIGKIFLPMGHFQLFSMILTFSKGPFLIILHRL